MTTWAQRTGSSAKNTGTLSRMTNSEAAVNNVRRNLPHKQGCAGWNTLHDSGGHMKDIKHLVGWAIAIGVGAASFTALAQVQPAELAREYMVRGAAAIEMAKSDGDLAAAEKEFRTATEIDPTLAAAWFNLGTTQSKLKKYTDALASFQRYLNLDPKAEDAQKVRDEIIKIKYRQERMEEQSKPGWTQLGRKPDGSTIYIDRSTIKREGNRATVLHLLDLAKPPPGGWENHSVKGVIRIDCGSSRWTWVRMEAFREHMGTGELLLSSDKNGNWNPEQNWKSIASDDWPRLIANAICE